LFWLNKYGLDELIKVRRSIVEIGLLLLLISFPYYPASIYIVVRQNAGIFRIHEWGRDHEVRRGSIAGDRDIPHYRYSEQGFDIRIVWHGLQRVPEEDQEIDFSVSDLRPDLLIAPEWTALQFNNPEAQYILKHLPGCAGGINLMVSQ